MGDKNGVATPLAPADRVAGMRFRIVRKCPIPVGPNEPREGMRRPCTIPETLRRCPNWTVAQLVEFYDQFHPPLGVADAPATGGGDDPYADVVPIWGWAAKLRGAGMSTAVAQYTACIVALTDVAVSLQMVEPGQGPEWDVAKAQVGERDDQDHFEQTNRALHDAEQSLRWRLMWHLEFEARRVIREKADEGVPPVNRPARKGARRA